MQVFLLTWTGVEGMGDLDNEDVIEVALYAGVPCLSLEAAKKVAQLEANEQADALEQPRETLEWEQSEKGDEHEADALALRFLIRKMDVFE